MLSSERNQERPHNQETVLAKDHAAQSDDLTRSKMVASRNQANMLGSSTNSVAATSSPSGALIKGGIKTEKMHMNQY